MPSTLQRRNGKALRGPGGKALRTNLDGSCCCNPTSVCLDCENNACGDDTGMEQASISVTVQDVEALTGIVDDASIRWELDFDPNGSWTVFPEDVGPCHNLYVAIIGEGRAIDTIAEVGQPDTYEGTFFLMVRYDCPVDEDGDPVPGKMLVQAAILSDILPPRYATEGKIFSSLPNFSTYDGGGLPRQDQGGEYTVTRCGRTTAAGIANYQTGDGSSVPQAGTGFMGQNGSISVT